MTDRYLVGMDCGTTNIKAVLLGEDGKIKAEASRPSRTFSPGVGMQEQDAEDWWEEAASIFRELAEKAGSEIMKQVKGICISSHTVSLLPIDKAGKPLRRAIIYSDGRSEKELDEIVEKVGREKYIRLVGGQPAAAFLPGKLLWFMRREPGIFKKTACLLQASSYINYRLTGVLSSDMDQATRTQCLDLNSMTWSGEIGQAIGVELDQYLPKPAAVDEIIGTVTEAASRKTGLAAGTLVLAGCSDAMASMIATGMSQLGDAGESSGTSSLVFVGCGKKSATDLPVVTRPCPIEGMPWVFDAPITTTGAALRWYIRNFCSIQENLCAKTGWNIYDNLNREAMEAQPGSGGLFFFPYLLGERAPLWNDYARGMFIGMNMNMTHADLTRSVFEGTAFALKHVVETVKKSGGQYKSLRVCGGGAKSRTWSRIKASMLHCPVYEIDGTSGDVPVGDALLAGVKAGVFPSLGEAVRRTIRVKEEVLPNPEWEEAYDALYPYYIDFYRDVDKDLERLKKDLEGIPFRKN